MVYSTIAALSSILSPGCSFSNFFAFFRAMRTDAITAGTEVAQKARAVSSETCGRSGGNIPARGLLRPPSSKKLASTIRCATPASSPEVTEASVGTENWLVVAEGFGGGEIGGRNDSSGELVAAAAPAVCFGMTGIEGNEKLPRLL